MSVTCVCGRTFEKAFGMRVHQRTCPATAPICRDCKTPQPVDHDCPEAGRQDVIDEAGRILAEIIRKSA